MAVSHGPGLRQSPDRVHCDLSLTPTAIAGGSCLDHPGPRTTRPYESAALNPTIPRLGKPGILRTIDPPTAHSMEGTLRPKSHVHLSFQMTRPSHAGMISVTQSCRERDMLDPHNATHTEGSGLVQSDTTCMGHGVC